MIRRQKLLQKEEVMATDGCFVRGGEVVQTANVMPISLPNIPQGGVAVAHNPKAELWLYLYDGALYRYQAEHTLRVLDHVQQAIYQLDQSCNRSAILVLANGKLFSVGEDVVAIMQWEYEIKAFTVHKGRVFAITSKGELYWHGINALSYFPSNQGAGHIQLPTEQGEWLALCSVQDAVYVLGSRALRIFHAYAECETFRLEGGMLTYPEMIPNTHAVQGSKLYFYTERGLYCYDGSLHQLTEWDSNLTDFRSAVCQGDTYYLLCRHRYYGGVLFCYDLQANCSYFLFGEWQSMVSTEQVILSGQEHVTFGNSGSKEWAVYGRQLPTDGRRRLLKSLSVVSDEPITIALSVDGQVKVIQRAQGKVPIYLSGTKFVLSLRGMGRVQSVEGEWEVQDDL